MACKAKKPVTLDLSSPEATQGTFKRIAGSQSDAFNTIVINQAFSSLWRAHADAEGRDKLLLAAAVAMGGVQPRDEVEGMLAAQLVATHSAAMECYRRAMIEEQSFEGRRENLNQANKLVRSYASLLEALDRHRGKGQQRVTVEHVHVHQGGRAIVGTVHPGGGDSKQNEEQPHAPAITREPGAPMLCPDPERETVPIASGTGAAALQNARRRPR